jgi:hypothetical protein
VKKPRSLAKLAVLAALALSGFALAGVMSGVGLATDTGTTGTDTGTTDTGTTTTDTGTTTTDTGTTTTTTTQPPGGEGCTPGYWKTHPESWGPTGYTTGMSVGSVFSNASGDLASTSLLDALSLSGGPTIADAKNLLVHHAVAALLNASHPGVDYAFSAADVIAWTNAMLMSSDRSAILGLKSLFDTENNRGCPLN